jgi:hypothetical protein
MPVKTGYGNLFKKPILERLGEYFERAQKNHRPGICRAARTVVKLVSIIRLEVLCLPVGLEDSDDLIDDVGVAGARDPNVPLELYVVRVIRTEEPIR